MWEELDNYLTVFVTSMVKFVFGPFVGANLSVLEAATFTVLGAMTTVVILSFVGEKLRRFIYGRYFKNRKLFTPKNRKRVKFVKNYGLKGIAFLTPVIFGPIIGTMLASSMGESRRKVVSYMLASSVFWAIILSTIAHYAVSFKPFLNLLNIS